LADLSQVVGYEAEYRGLMLSLNTVMHSSAYGMNQPNALNFDALCHIVWTLLFRALGRTAQFFNVEVPPETAGIVTYSYEQIFDADEAALDLLR
jgi:hypothetical protein